MSNSLIPIRETAEPVDEIEVSELVARSAKTQTPVYPIGGGTALTYGVKPTRPGCGLSSGKLRRIIDYPARDLTITVEAGVTIAELAQRLASEGQQLPVDVPNARRATLGGLVATDPAGPRRFRWGTVRDYVIGLRAVDGQGVAFSAGGRVVKNAAGYNLCRLLTGSLGTLGVITQVTLMVKPVPEASAFVAWGVRDLESAEALLADLIHTQTVPSAIELLAGPAPRRIPCLADLSGSCAAIVTVGFEGTRAEVDWMNEQLQREWSRLEIAGALTIRGGDASSLWEWLAEFPGRGDETDESPGIVVAIRVVPSRAITMVQLLTQWEPNCSIQAHAGDGVVIARCHGDEAQVRDFVVGKLRPRAVAEGGSVVVLAWSDGDLWNQDAVWGQPGDGIAVMHSIKKQFDPRGILNPGRFVFGDA